jgi:hypothetical protein
VLFKRKLYHTFFGSFSSIERFKFVKDLKIICAGGDGTAHSMLEEMDKVEFSDILEQPPVALLPLGTHFKPKSHF